jgi:hypothetical protein
MMKAQTSRRLRKLHHYVGLFFTPAIIFFAFSGMLQTIGLHENHGPGPQPQAWIRWMASVHKDQSPPHAKAPRPAQPAPKEAGHDDHDDHGPAAPLQKDKGPSPIPLKAFVLLLSLGLIASSLLGVTIALTSPIGRGRNIAILVAGAVLPVLLLFV